MSKIEPIAMTIDIDKYEGTVPNGYDLVVYEKGEEEWLGTDASLKAGQSEGWWPATVIPLRI